MTSIIVLFMVMIEASNLGLTPSEIVGLLPTWCRAVSLRRFRLHSSSPSPVVYGRLASNNEIVAVKTAGLSTLFVLRPAIILGLCLSGILLYLTYAPIPMANHQAKQKVMADMEDLFYKTLKEDPPDRPQRTGRS